MSSYGDFDSAFSLTLYLAHLREPALILFLIYISIEIQSPRQRWEDWKIQRGINCSRMAFKSLRLLTVTKLFFLVFINIPIESRVSDVDDPERECVDRWIHIRNLPRRFNLDLIANCSGYPLYGDFCPYVLNHGLGQKTHNHSHSWYRTDPMMLEIIFHRRMLEYPCLTDDPDDAAAIYLPYYAGIDSLRYLYGPDVNSSFEHGLDLFKFISQVDSPEIWNRRKGHDHFLVMARQAWDFSQPLTNNPLIWGTSFLELPEFFNVSALTLESRAWPWQEQAVPYPTSFHPSNVALLESWLNRVRSSRRTTLMIFVGGGGISSSPNIRRSIRLECESSKNLTSSRFGYSKLCEFVNCSNGVCEHDPIRFMKPMLQSSFCLQPPGDTPTRRSTFDGIISGCIPVFFDEQSAKDQYSWHLRPEKYREFSVFIPKEDVVFKEKTILEILTAIPRSKVRMMRDKIVESIPRVMYRKHGSSVGLGWKKRDAFDIAIDGTLQRIRSRLEDVPLQDS